MSLQKDHDGNLSGDFMDFSMEEDGEQLAHKKQVRKKLEERLERRRLKEEFDELDGGFDWDEIDNK